MSRLAFTFSHVPVSHAVNVFLKALLNWSQIALRQKSSLTRRGFDLIGTALSVCDSVDRRHRRMKADEGRDV